VNSPSYGHEEIEISKRGVRDIAKRKKEKTTSFVQQHKSRT
jgi:hypothetical protein